MHHKAQTELDDGGEAAKKQVGAASRSVKEEEEAELPPRTPTPKPKPAPSQTTTTPPKQEQAGSKPKSKAKAAPAKVPPASPGSAPTTGYNRAAKLRNRVQTVLSSGKALTDIIDAQTAWTWARTDAMNGRIKVQLRMISQATNADGVAVHLAAEPKCWKSLVNENKLAAMCDQFFSLEGMVKEAEDLIAGAWRMHHAR